MIINQKLIIDSEPQKSTQQDTLFIVMMLQKYTIYSEVLTDLRLDVYFHIRYQYSILNQFAENGPPGFSSLRFVEYLISIISE